MLVLVVSVWCLKLNMPLIQPCLPQNEGLVREGLARWGEGFLLVFSVTDRASFSFLQPLHTALTTAKTTPNFPCVMVANKTDLGVYRVKLAINVLVQVCVLSCRSGKN